MSKFKVEELSSFWSTESLRKNVEKRLKELESEGWEIVSVSFGINVWWVVSAFITVKCK